MTIARCLLAACLLVAAGAAFAVDAGGDPGNEVTRADLNRAQQRVAEVQKELSGARSALTRGQHHLREAEQAAGAVAAALRQLDIREREISRSLGRVQAEYNALATRIERQQMALAHDARHAWLLGREQQLRLWLNADDPQTVARIARYYEYLQRDRVRRLEEYRQSREKLADAERRVLAEQAQLDDTRRELAGRQSELAQARRARQQAVMELAAELKTQKSELARRQADAAALKRLFGQVREAYRAVPPPPERASGQAVASPLKQRKGKLRWPANGRLVARFGSPVAEAEGKLSLNGIVIAAGEGSEVRAVHAGRVVFAEWLRGYGQLLILDHGDGFLTAYGYNQSLLRAVGDWVEEGASIATVGASGGRANPGLYFELRQGGEPQDPARWLQR